MDANVLTVVGISLAGAVLLALCVYLGVLAYRNRYGRIATVSPAVRAARSPLRRGCEFVLAHFALEVVGIGFAVVEALDLNANKAACAAPGCLDSLEIIFYVVSGIKYAVWILSLFIEHTVKCGECRRRRATRDSSLTLSSAPARMSVVRAGRGYISSEWVETLLRLSLVPAILVDGVLVNIDTAVGAPNQSLLLRIAATVLLGVDTLVLVRQSVRRAVFIHSNDGDPHYDLAHVAVAILLALFDIVLIFDFITLHFVDVIGSQRGTLTSIALTNRPTLMLIAVFFHSIIAGLSSMLGFSITHSDRALRTAPAARIQTLNVYLRWFNLSYFPTLVANFFVYVLAAAIYVSLFVLSEAFFDGSALVSTPFDSTEARDAFRVLLVLLFVATYALSGWLLLNLIVSLVRRLGAAYGLRKPFDCSSYAMRVNAILAECNANFRVNTAMRTA